MNDGPRTSQRLQDLWARSVENRRRALGLSQAQVAVLAGMTQAGVSLVESGKALPRDDTKVALARALGTTPGDLFPWPPMEDLVA